MWGPVVTHTHAGADAHTTTNGCGHGIDRCVLEGGMERFWKSIVPLIFANPAEICELRDLTRHLVKLRQDRNRARNRIHKVL